MIVIGTLVTGSVETFARKIQRARELIVLGAAGLSSMLLHKPNIHKSSSPEVTLPIAVLT